MNRKIWKALGIAVCMLALAVPRAMAELREYLVSNNEHFADAVGRINNESNIGDENEIVLMYDITLEGNYILTNGKKTTIKGNNHTLRGGYNATIAVSGEKTVLNLGAQDYKGTLTIDGDENAPTGPFVDISNGATVNMYEHVTLQNRQQVDQACVVLEENSVFTMYGGVIQNCKGKYGGVSLKNGSRFIMEGGTISECSANAGGGLYADNSTVTIKDGTISGCKAVNGYGGGLYAKNYSTVTIEGGTISGCTTSDAGMGGGLYAYNSTITISGGTIENNKATYGGGVALNNSWINSITNWKVIGNKAYKAKSSGNGGIGGGIYLDSVSMNVSAGSNRIYNNTADIHGADICLEKGASITLPDAAGMGATYLDSGINIDGWYKDKPPESGQPVKALQQLSDDRQWSLVASYKADPVRIEIDANGGVGGSVSQTVQKGTNVTLEAPTKEGHLFKGWEDENKKIYPAGEDGKVKITVTGAMTLTAVWKDRTFTVTYVLLNGKTRTETAAYGQNVTLVEEPRTGYTFVGWKDGEKVYHAGETITVTGDMTLTAEWKKLPSAENLPKTGDESPVLLWGAALAVSAAACFMLRRKK